MTWMRWNLPLVFLCWAAVAPAQEESLALGRRRRPPPVCPVTPGVPPAQLGLPAPMPPADPNAPSPLPPMTDAAAPPESSGFQEALASTGEGGTQPGTSYAPAFFGDFISGSGVKNIGGSNGSSILVLAPINRHAGAYKIADNESPRPTDRLFYFYNHFSRVNQDLNPGLTPLNVQRHVLGFEKTFLDGWASFGMRLPLVETYGSPALATRQFADMTLVTKVALWDDPTAGRFLSAGMAVTVPTGRDEIFTSPGSGNRLVLADVLLQPYAGWIWNPRSRWYAHGFHALVLPTDSRDATQMFNDIGLGWWLFRDANAPGIRGVAPTMELHVNTPLNRRELGTGPIGYLDSVNMTFGGYVILAKATLGGAVGVPLMSPRPFAVEALARCEWKF